MKCRIAVSAALLLGALFSSASPYDPSQLGIVPELERVEVTRPGWFSDVWSVQVTISNAYQCYLGVSFRDRSGYVFDLRPSRLFDDEESQTFVPSPAGITTKISFRSTVFPEGFEPTEVRCCLWRTLVPRELCQGVSEDDYAEVPCKYCKKNGFHMEGRLADSGWMMIR